MTETVFIEDLPCVRCKEVKPRSVCCEMCSKQFCTECMEISNTYHKVLKGQPSAHWYCPHCEPKALKVIKADFDVEERCRVALEAMERRMVKREAELYDKVSKNALEMVAKHLADKEVKPATPVTKVKEVVSTMIDSNNTEQKERESRKLNVIIHNITENPTNDDEEKNDDKDYLRGLTTELELPEGAGIAKTVRLGKLPTDQSKSRPLKVAFDSENSKKNFMSKLGKLAEAPEEFKKISVSHDMTKDDREQNRKLVAEAKNKTKEDPTGNWVFRVKGLPGMRRIVRIEKKRSTPTKEIQHLQTPTGNN